MHFNWLLGLHQNVQSAIICCFASICSGRLACLCRPALVGFTFQTSSFQCTDSLFCNSSVVCNLQTAPAWHNVTVMACCASWCALCQYKTDLNSVVRVHKPNSASVGSWNRSHNRSGNPVEPVNFNGTVESQSAGYYLVDVESLVNPKCTCIILAFFFHLCQSAFHKHTDTWPHVIFSWVTCWTHHSVFLCVCV